MIKNRFEVTGMSCSACAAYVDKIVLQLPGVKTVSVNLLKKSMTVVYDESLLDVATIENTVNNAGYKAMFKGVKNQSKRGASAESEPAGGVEYFELKFRLIVSAIFGLPLFYLSMGHMYGWPLLEAFHGEANSLIFVFTQFILLLPIVFANFKFFENGLKSLFKGAPNMDSLIAIGSGAAIVYGIYAIYKVGYGLGHGNIEMVKTFSMDVYFESAGMILLLITFGKFLEARAKGKTSEAISHLINLAPKTAAVIREGKEQEISVDSIIVGDILAIKAGDSVAVDGVVIEGASSVDESALTGESIPAEKSVGDKVLSASINKTGFIKVRAEKVGADTALASIIRLVDEATASKTPIAKLADKISGYFVPTVIVVAGLTVFGWLAAGHSFEFALSMGIAVLVISCPCALGLATPTAIMVGTGKGASMGMLIKSAEALETFHKADVVVFDKTGTITVGHPVVTDIVSAEDDSQRLMQIAASLEKLSGHPLSEAITEAAAKQNIEYLAVSDFEVISGAGVSGIINGTTCRGGNHRMLEQYKIGAGRFKEVADELMAAGKTSLYFTEGDRVIGVIGAADQVKMSAKGAVEQLKAIGIEVMLLTGDNSAAAAAIGREVGITSIIAEVLPQNKEEEIRKLQLAGKCVAMVGDGINDAPALAAADVGIAIGAGTDIAIESADIVLMRDDLFDVAGVLKLSRAVIKNIKQNLFWAFFYNIIGIPLAAGLFYVSFGLKLSPMFAAFAMSLSSVFVVSNALRLRRFKIV